MNKKSIKDLKDTEIKGKRVFVRVDFNTPMDGAAITDDSRIQASLPTIKYLIERGARVIVASHLGRPKGKVNEEYRLTPQAKSLETLLGQKVYKTDDCIGPEVEKAIGLLQDGEVLLLENVRFYKEEEANDETFSRKLASLADIYVNDAFGTAHRAHASTAGITDFIPGYAGLLIEKELALMGKALTNPEKPFIAIIGGAKVSSKLGVLKNLLGKVDVLLIGGGMAYTFYKAKGINVGKSLVEDALLDEAKAFLALAENSKTKVVFPTDVVAASEFSADAQTKVVSINEIPEGWQGLDAGPATISAFKAEIAQAKTIVWNGPVGVFEMEQFAKGTNAIAKALAESNAITIIGGGDSASAIEKSGFADKVTHISTGGGASLEFLEGKILPGIAALQDK